ncbi:hypothetical protein QNA08_10615 [Chelatococcus sp. SYSU_G07232]|uniref:DUF2946 domain-containing protein n=1 Tax=Chelatococcus albus TaxID=3047466 RepID=A0ABT7AH37_9HYPH|nr:hypothetical protein [Chelatococcus sp. SYSU_G07232]MDJ1158684.1 hypothetical protein [Chelatococcus sp. SYSU_G07232]
MHGRLHSRLVAILAVLALSLSLVAQSVMSTDMAMAGLGASDRGATMATVAAVDDMSASEGCDACGGSGDHGMPMGSCSTLCSASAAVVMPFVPMARVSTTRVGGRDEPLLVGRHGSPDPHPPKSSTLG